ncbi:MAG: RhuM family protein [Lentisphaeria bacterium]|nr:RhuM family protein [Lentisphaeria bacterium]
MPPKKLKQPGNNPAKESGGRGEIVLYQTEDGTVKIQCRFEDETIWMTQQLMADLFQTSVPNISMHIRNIFEEGELNPAATIKNFLTVRQEGSRQVNRQLDHYNLDMIISVGYRVKSLIATRFRIWATERLREYMLKGFVMDDERLKNPPLPDSGVPDYFDEWLERISATAGAADALKALEKAARDLPEGRGD